MNIKLILAYFGLPFMGWQKTPMGPSIEESLETALQKILQHPVQLQAASRTDAGVHAKGQVVNFSTDKELDLKNLLRSLNRMLPKEISVVEAEACPDNFHPTLDTTKKEYHYLICHGPHQLPFHRHTSWHFPYSLNLDRMQKAARLLLGTHDFSAFCNERKLWDRDPVCTLESIAIHPLETNRLAIAIIGDHFLYKMMRNLAGTLAYAGCGKIDPEQIRAILAGKDRTQAGVTAPAHGLILHRVFYS